MNAYPGRNPKESVTNGAEETGIVASHVPWYLSAYFPVSRTTTGTALSQVSQPKPTESRNNMESTNQCSSKALKPKQGIKKRPASKNSKKAASNIPETTREKKNPDINNIDVSSFDVSGLPPPVCSCTGTSRVCYKWGMGGWQSSCCTLTISTFPLPMSTTRPAYRMAGRKMSNGAYVKLLLRLAGEGYDLSQPVDLKNHWARHGTNKFVTIK